MANVHEMLFDELEEIEYIKKVGDLHKLTNRGAKYVELFEKNLYKNGKRKFELIGTFDEKTGERRCCLSLLLLAAGRPYALPYSETEINEANEKTLETLNSMSF